MKIAIFPTIKPPGKSCAYSGVVAVLFCVVCAHFAVAAPVGNTSEVSNLLREAASRDSRFEVAATAMEAGDLREATSELSRLLRVQPADETLNFVYGLLLLQQGRHSHATLAFERVLNVNTHHQRARLELARAYYHLGQYDQATRHFEYVLDQHPPPAVRTNIEIYIQRIRYEEKGFRVRSRIEVGVLYDDNVNYGPSSRIIGIAPINIGTLWLDRLELNPEDTPRSAWGGFASLASVWSWRAYRDATWSWRGYGSAQANKLHNASDYELGVLRVGAGPQVVRGVHTAHLPLRIEYITRGGDSLATITGLAPAVTRRLSERTTIEATAAADYRDYARNRDRDGLYYTVGARISLRPPTGRMQYATGGRIIRERPDAAVWRNEGYELFASALATPSPRLLCYGNASTRFSEYDRREPLAPRDRRDQQWNATVGLEWRLTSSIGFDINVQYTRNHSTFDIYDYERFASTWSTYYAF